MGRGAVPDTMDDDMGLDEEAGLRYSLGGGKYVTILRCCVWGLLCLMYFDVF